MRAPNSRRRWFVWFALLLLVPGAACSTADRADRPLLAFAASGLRDVLDDLAREYRATGGDSMVFVFGSTGDLSAQLAAGAPADLFFSADEEAVDHLSARGIVLDSTHVMFAVGRLALLTYCAANANATSGQTCEPLDLAALATSRVRKLAIANPAYAPYGRAAQQALGRSNLWPSVESKIVMGASIAQAEQYVMTGNADAGLVALSLVLREPGRAYVEIDPALHDPVSQTVVLLSASMKQARAQAFLQFIGSETGRATLRRYGFELPQIPPAGVRTP